MLLSLLLLPSLLFASNALPEAQSESQVTSEETIAMNENEIEEPKRLAIKDNESFENSDEEETRSLDDYFNLDWDEIAVLLSLTPSQIVEAKYLTELAVSKTEELYPNQSHYQDDGDAFRHTYWSALLARNFGDEFSRNLTNAHESSEPDGIDKTMDLHNNSNGIKLYHEWVDKIAYSGIYPLDNLASFICHAIANGEIYDCVKINTYTDRLIYTSIGNSDINTFGIKGYVETIDADDYGFEEQYFFNMKSKNVETNQNTTIFTRRLRTGYIQNQYVVLSPRRENAGYATLELYFSTPILAVDLDICLWSNNEQLSGTGCGASVVEKPDYQTFIYHYNLLTDYNLSTNRNNPDRIRFDFPDQADGIAFRAQAPAVGDRNKGRICIGNMHIIFANPNY